MTPQETTVHCAVCGREYDSQQAVRMHAGQVHGGVSGRTARERADERRYHGEGR